MRRYGEFEEKGYRVGAYLPDGSPEGIAWKVDICKSEKLLYSFRIPMIYEPRFGPDTNDVARLEDITGQILAFLPEPDDFDYQVIARIDGLLAGIK